MKILIVFHSLTGHVAELAMAIADGAQDAGAEVRIRRIPSLVGPEDRIQEIQSRMTSTITADIEDATREDLRWADGTAFGCPTRYGTISTELKKFFDETGDFWESGEIGGKVAAVFTSGGTQHGGQESTLLSMMVPLFHLGYVVMGCPPGVSAQLSMDSIHGGSPYGVSSVSGPDGSRPAADADVQLARLTGKRLAELAGKLAGKPSMKSAA